MRSKILTMLCALMIIGSPSQAQNWGNRLKNKVVNKLENKAEQKADQAIDSAIDKPVDKTEQKVKESVKSNNSEKKTIEDKSSDQPPANEVPSDADMQQFLEMMGGGAVSIEDYPDLDDIKPSSFKGSFDMHMEATKNGRSKDEGSVSWYIREYEVAMIPIVETNGEQQDSRIIIDRKKGIMTILTNNNGDKTGMIMKMKTISVDLSEVEDPEDIENMTVKVMKNEIRNINGYRCYKVLAYNDEIESITWVTEDIPLDMQQLMGFMNVQSNGKSAYEDKFGHIKGMMIESTSTDKKSGDIDKVTMENIKVGSPQTDVFSTEGYNLMALPGF